MGAGGISFISAARAVRSHWYTLLDTECGIKEKADALRERSAPPSFCINEKKKEKASNAINNNFLTTSRRGYSSGLADEFSLIVGKEKRLRGPPI